MFVLGPSAAVELAIGLRLAHASKHRQRDPETGERLFNHGKLRVFANSSLRKLMRAARRDKIPAERMTIIALAMRANGLRVA